MIWSVDFSTRISLSQEWNMASSVSHTDGVLLLGILMNISPLNSVDDARGSELLPTTVDT